MHVCRNSFLSHTSDTLPTKTRQQNASARPARRPPRTAATQEKKNQSVKAPHRNRHWPQHAAPEGIARVGRKLFSNASAPVLCKRVGHNVTFVQSCRYLRLKG